MKKYLYQAANICENLLHIFNIHNQSRFNSKLHQMHLLKKNAQEFWSDSSFKLTYEHYVISKLCLFTHRIRNSNTLELKMLAKRSLYAQMSKNIVGYTCKVRFYAIGQFQMLLRSH